MPTTITAIRLDPDFASAYGLASACYTFRKANGWVIDREQEIAEATKLARCAVELGKDDALVLSSGGFSLAYVTGELEHGAALIDQALVLNPNEVRAWVQSGWARIWLGDLEIAIEHLFLKCDRADREPNYGPESRNGSAPGDEELVRIPAAPSVECSAGPGISGSSVARQPG